MSRENEVLRRNKECIDAIEEMLCFLEHRTFLQFEARTALHVSIPKFSKPVGHRHHCDPIPVNESFEHQYGFRRNFIEEMAEDFNDAIQPIKSKWVQILKEELADFYLNTAKEELKTINKEK